MLLNIYSIKLAAICMLLWATRFHNTSNSNQGSLGFLANEYGCLCLCMCVWCMHLCVIWNDSVSKKVRTL